MKKVILLMMFFLFVILLSSCEKPKEVPIPTKVTFRYDYETLYETYTYDKNIDFSTLYVGSAPKKSTFVSGDVWYECVFSGWSSIKEGDGDVVCYPRFNQIKKDNPIYGVYNKSGLIKFMKTCSISEMYINEKYYPQYRYFVKEHYYIGYIEELDLFCLTFSESNKYLIAYYFKYKQFNDTYKAFADIGYEIRTPENMKKSIYYMINVCK